jgi:U3 small nucleolar RNA-associated protein 10
LTTFLPYHTLPIFPAVLSILPSSIPTQYKFLHPYIRSLAQPHRHAIIQAATVDTSLVSTLNTYVLQVTKAHQHYPALLAFWAGVMTEATSGMLDKSRSGRMGVQQQNEQDIILRLLPTLNEGLALKKAPDLRIGCYMLLSVMASKGALDDNLLTAMMEAVVLGWTAGTINTGLVCLSILSQHRGPKRFTGRLTKELLKVQNLPDLIVEISKKQRVDKFANGLSLALVHRLGKNGDVSGLETIVQIFGKQVLSDAQLAGITKALLRMAHQIDSKNPQEDVRLILVSSLVALARLPGHSGSVVQDVMKVIDMDELEMKLHTSIRREKPSELPSGDTETKDLGKQAGSKRPTFVTLLERLPKRTTNELSFLSHDASHVYPELCEAFLAATTRPGDLDLFDEAPILRRSSALEDTLYLSFYTRIWCGPYPVLAKTTALRMATRYLSRNIGANVDVQAVIPYAIAALSEPAARARRAAAELLVTIDRLYPVNIESKESKKQFQQWALDDIYGPGERTQRIEWLSIDVVTRFLRDLLIPALEECVLDEKHVESVFQKFLNSPRNSENAKKHEKGRLPQSARLSILSFLASHVVNTPLYMVKLRLLLSLNHIRSVANTSRTKLLLPVLQQWVVLKPLEALECCQVEKIEFGEFNESVVMTVAANDKDGLVFLSKVIHGDVATDRPELVRAIFRRLRSMWPSLKGENQLHTAQVLLDSSQSLPEDGSYHELACEESAKLLRTVPLSSDILKSFLAQLPTAAKLVDKRPVTKRRRTSHGEVAKTLIPDSKQFSAAIRKVTFVLQLVDSSDPGSHPDLLKGLFNTLAELQHFKAQVASELAYLQGLVLSSLLAILKTYKLTPSLNLDRSSIRTDLLVDCVQKTGSPQVQNAALLLIACLADATPELVLHSVMPIFTFMGNSVLRQNDEYSSYVISQTIHEVIPPLISSLRKEKGNPVIGAAELLLSFVAAYEHVPAHRRQGLFTSLIQTLGAEDFLFALLAMLIDKYGPIDSIKIFAVEISTSFSVEIQLQSAGKLLDLIGDALKPKPTYSTVLLNANDESVQTPQEAVLNELILLQYLLQQRNLATQTGKMLARDDMVAARVRDLYSNILENVLVLADSLKEQKHLHSACGNVLESLLGLLSTSEFVKSVEALLDRPNESLRRKILRSLEIRIGQENASDAVSRLAMLGFLPQLTAIIRESRDISYKHTAVACVDKISDKYGKKDVEAVAAAAKTIASEHCLGQSDDRLRIMALLCLTSLVEILREGIVSVLPIAIPKALEYMAASLKGDVEAQKLHNAGYAFISSLIHHLPYMVSGGDLDGLLSISNASAEADLDDEADESRVQCLHLAAQQIDAKTLFGALDKDWAETMAAGTFVRPPRILTFS